MFFIDTIKYRCAVKKAKEESNRQLNEYFEFGDRIHGALLRAEDIVGSGILGITTENITQTDGGFGLVIKYKVDDRLSVVIYRNCNEKAAETLGRNDDYFHVLDFYIDGVRITDRSNEVYAKLTNKTVSAIWKKVEDHCHKSDVVLADYFAKEATSKHNKKLLENDKSQKPHHIDSWEPGKRQAKTRSFRSRKNYANRKSDTKTKETTND